MFASASHCNDDRMFGAGLTVSEMISHGAYRLVVTIENLIRRIG